MFSGRTGIFSPDRLARRTGAADGWLACDVPYDCKVRASVQAMSSNGYTS